MTPPPRELEGRFVGFGARIPEEHPAVAESFGDPRRQTRHRLGVEHIGRMRQLLGLLLNCTDYAGMAMAETGHRQATEEIQVTVAVCVVQIGAMATNERQWHAAVVVD